MTTMTHSTAETDVQAVRSGFEAVGAGNLAAFADGFHADATWNHRNPDRLGGTKHGIEEILAFLGASMELTAGTLRTRAELFMPMAPDTWRCSPGSRGARPDGRTFDDTQVLYFQLEDGKVRSVDQFVGDPPAVTAFWA